MSKKISKKTAKGPSKPATEKRTHHPHEPNAESANAARGPSVEQIETMGSAAPASARKGRRRSGGDRAARNRKEAAQSGNQAAPAHEAAPVLVPETPVAVPPSQRIVPLSPAARVEEEGGAIVIRFPPVAPPPFQTPPEPLKKPAPPPVSVRAPAVGPAPAPRAREEAPAGRQPREERREEHRGERRDEHRGPRRPVVEAAEIRPAAEQAEPARPTDTGRLDEAAWQKLSPSQKRRLRRKRRRDNKRTEVRPPKLTEPSRPAADDLPAESPDTEELDVVARADWLDELEPTEVDVREAAALAEPATGEIPTPPRSEAVPPQEKGRRRRRRGRRSTRHEEMEAAPTGSATAEPETIAPPEEAPTKGTREMIINTIPREECRIGILCQGRLEEIYFERATSENHVGNIYKGVVTNVEPSIQAAFVDFGQGKNGFLHISDLHPQYFPNGGGQTENVGHKMPRRSRPPIQRCLRRGQEVIVQVTKEGIGTKGPTLSTYLSIPGRFLVMMPGMGRLGVSRRIEDDEAREKLRSVLAELDLPESMGFIARTAALDRTKRELQNDLTYLTRLWKAVENRTKNDPAPAELYRESDLVIRTIRDVFSTDIERLVVDDPEVATRAQEFLSIFSPRSHDLVNTYTDPEPIFHKYGIEAELERLHSRHVPLKSGGSLVIEPTEALVAIDVNSGRFRTEADAEATAFKINLEAADEIARQLRLRDLGGVIICDFIDMRAESHRREIERRLIRNLKEHKERAKVLRTSAFGIIELTRQRQRASLTRSVYQDCRHCRGTGLVKTIESVALDVMRLVQLAVTRQHIHMIEVTISPDVAFLLQNRKRRLLYELESKNRRVISLRSDPNYGLDQVEIRCTDARGRVVPYL